MKHKQLSLVVRFVSLFYVSLVVLATSSTLAQTAPQNLPSLTLSTVEYTDWHLPEITLYADAVAMDNDPSAGAAYLMGGENDALFFDGTDYTVDVSEIRDNDGVGSFSYQWYAGVDDNGVIITQQIVGATSAIYNYDGANVPAGAGVTLMQVEITHVDLEGFPQTFMATLHSGHIIAVAENGMAVGDTVSWDIDQRIMRERGYESILSENQRVYHSRFSFGLSDSEYVVEDVITDFDADYGIAIERQLMNTRVVQGFSALSTTDITSTVTVNVDRDFSLLHATQGDITLSLIGSAIRYDAEIVMMTAGVSDVNGGGFLSDEYVWQIDGVTVESATSNVYRLQLGDLSADGGILSGKATYEDSLGYVVTMSSTFALSALSDNEDRAYILGGENNEFFVNGDNYTVDVSEIYDTDGSGNFSYQWYMGVDNNGAVSKYPIIGKNAQVYSYNSAHAPGLPGGQIMAAEVSYIGANGEEKSVIATLHSGHLIAITENGLAAGDTVSWRVDSLIAYERGYEDILGTKVSIYRYENTLALLDGADEYVVRAGRIGTVSPYGVIIEQEFLNTSEGQQSQTLTVSVGRDFNLLRSTQGDLTLSLIGSAIRYGAEITVVTTGVSDANGGGFLPDQYVWQIDGVAIESATSSVYRLQADDILVAEGGRLSAQAVYRDSFGYEVTLSSTFRAQNRIDLGDRAVSIVAADGLIRGSTLSLSIVNRESGQSIGDNVEWRYCKYPRAHGVGGDCNDVRNEQQGAAGNMYVLLFKPPEERPYIVAEGEIVHASVTSSFTAVLLGRIPPVHPLRLVGDPGDKIGENEYFFHGASRFSLYMGEDVYAHGATLNMPFPSQGCSSDRPGNIACTGFFFIERSRQYFITPSFDETDNNYADENIYGYGLAIQKDDNMMLMPDSNGYLSTKALYESTPVLIMGDLSRDIPIWTPRGYPQIARGYGEQGDGGMTLTLYFTGGTHSQLVEDSFGEPLYVLTSLENQYAVDSNGARKIPYNRIIDRIGTNVLTLYSPGAIEQALMIIDGEVTIGAVATLSVNLLRDSHDSGSIEHTIFIGNRQVASGDRLSAEYSYRLSAVDVLEMLINAPLNASLRYANSKYRRGLSAGLNVPLTKELSSALTLTLNHNGAMKLQASDGLLRGSTLSIDFGEEAADDFYIDWWHCNAATLSVDGCVSAAGTTQGDDGVIPDNGQAPFYVLNTVLSTVYSHIVARAGRYGAGGSDYLAVMAISAQNDYTLSVSALSINIVGDAEDLIAPGMFLYDTDSVFSVTVLLSMDTSQTPYGAFVKEMGDISWNLSFLDVGNNENNVTINNTETVTMSGFNNFDDDSYAQILAVTINGIVLADSFGEHIQTINITSSEHITESSVILRRRISATIDIEQNHVTLDDNAGRVWDAPSYQWQYRQLSADPWQNIADADESFWTLSEEQINDEDFGPYVRLQLTDEEEITPGVVVTVRRYSNEILAGGIANPTPPTDRIILTATDDSPCIVDAACDELHLGYVYQLMINDHAPLVNYLGQTLQMAYFNADTDVQWQLAAGADGEYRDLTVTLERELNRYTINVSNFLNEDGTSYGFLRAKVTDNRGQQRNPEDRATPESVFYTQSLSPDIAGTGRVYIPSPYASEIFADGLDYTAYTGGIEDANGVGNFSYQWYAGVDDNGTISVQLIEGATSQRYFFDSADVSAAAGVTVLQVSVLHTDLAGYEQTFMATLHSGRILSLVVGDLLAGDIISAVTITQYLHERGLVVDTGSSLLSQWMILNQQDLNNILLRIDSLSGYTLAATDFNPDSGAYVGDTVIYYRSFNYENGNNEPYFSDFLFVNMSLTGALTMSLSGDIVAEGATVVLITAEVSDANGGGFISYEWLRGEATITSANASSYELTGADLSAAMRGELSARANYRDSLGFETELSATLAAADDSVGTGAVTINGAASFAEGEVYTADTSGVRDDNGIGDFGYQWYANVNANVSLLLGETAATYTVQLSDFVTDNVENTVLGLSVSVVHTDVAGYTRDYNAVRLHADNVLSGNVELSLSGGIVAEGATVTLITAGVSDANGGGFISYKWLRDGVTIVGTNASDYELTNDDLLSAATGELSVRALYRDDLGFETALSAILPVMDDVTGTGRVYIPSPYDTEIFADGFTYTVNIGGIEDANGVGNFSYQWYAGADDNGAISTQPIDGATSQSYVFDSADVSAAAGVTVLQVSVLHTDLAGYEQTFMATLHSGRVLSLVAAGLSEGDIISAVMITQYLHERGLAVKLFTPSWFIFKQQNLSDVLRIIHEESSDYTLVSTDFNPSESTFGDSVKSYDVFNYENGDGNETYFSDLLIVNMPLTGALMVSLSGDIVAEGATVMLITTGVSDANGGGFISYEWLRDGATIAGANEIGYELTSDDLSAVMAGELSARAIYRDSLGFETELSAILAAADDSVGTGAVTINGAASFADGEVYTADTSGVRDDNGIGDFGYQWYANVNDNVSLLLGETAATYTVQLSDFVIDNVENTVLGLSVSVVHTDAAGYTRDYNAVRLHADNVLSGNVELSLSGGIVAEGATVTLITAGVSDANGGGFISYEWLRGDITIIGASASDYELTNDDLLAAATGELSVRAIYRDDLGFETALSAILPVMDDVTGTGRIYIPSPYDTEIFADGFSYTVNIGGIEDANGVGDFSYQWYAGADDNGAISTQLIDGATSQSYIFDSADVSAAAGVTVLQVSVLHTDLAGYEQTFMATLHSGRVLSLVAAGLSEGDIISAVMITQYLHERGLVAQFSIPVWLMFKQQRSSNFLRVIHEQSSDYTLVSTDFNPSDADFGDSVKSYDSFNYENGDGMETYNSDLLIVNMPLTGALMVSLSGDIVAEGATVMLITAEVSDANGGGFISYEWLRDGATITGANENRYELTSDDLLSAATGELSVRALYRDSLGFETELSATLPAAEDSVGTGYVTINGAASFAEGGVYTADTSGVVDENGIGDFGYQWYANVNANVSLLSGETNATYKVQLSDFVADGVVNTVLGLSVSVVHTDLAGYTRDYNAVRLHADNVLSGNVELSLLGDIVVAGATVTLITAGVSDNNGGGFISYEWLRDGVTIVGASASDYELTNDDLLSAATGELSVRALYRDDLGFETELSAALSAVGDSVGTGAVIINGADSFAAGEVYTADTSGVRDENGIGGFVYQWYVNINDNVSLLSGETNAGAVIINGADSFAAGEVYTADTSGVRDENGIGGFVYQWYVNINDNVSLLSGETNATYKVQLSDFVTDNVENTLLGLSVSVLHTDAAGYTRDYEAIRLHADNLLSGNVELSLLGGVVVENATVTVLTAGVLDANGGGFISYEWLRDGATIVGANENRYELTNDDLLAAATGELSVRALYRDSLGFETELSAILSATGDSVGTGSVVINGAASFASGEIYTADTSGVVDANGIGGFVYQWYVNINDNVSLLSGETNATYKVQLSDFVSDGVVNTVLGLSVSVLHTDAAGYTRDYDAVRLHADNVLSGNVELSLSGDIVVAGATVILITAGVSDANGGGFISYEWLRDGATITGANESRYELTNDDLSAAATGELSVRAKYRDSLGFETELSATLPAAEDSVGTGSVTINGAASFAEGEVYTADISGVVDANGIGGFVYQWYVNINDNVSLLSGETNATYKVQLSDFVAEGVVNTVLGLSVSVLHTDAAGYTRDYNAIRLHADNVLSGNVELSLSGGIVSEGATVMLITAEVSDANGGGFISYEWLRDGVTIAGANESRYELTNDDLLSAAAGKLSVRALYRDSLGFETALSAILSTVGDSVGTGEVTINGADSFAAGEVYTADTSGVRDANGIGGFVYQWYANVNDNVSLLSGETNATYKVQLSDFVADGVVNTVLGLSVSVLHTDAAGYTRDYNAVRLHADNVLSGNVELSLSGDIVVAGATVTLITAGVSDANGGGFISYEWLRDGVTIVGANASDYELTNDDLLSAAAGKLSVRALYRDNLGFETELSAVLSAADDSVGTGAVKIDGAASFAEGGVYTADTSGVVDENGIGDFGYQWYVNINDNVSLLSGETNATYKVQLSDFVADGVVNTVLGLSVSVLHTDAAGYTRDYNAVRLHADNVLSGNVELSLSGGIISEGATVMLITAGVSDANGGGFISYEWLRDGVTIVGANESDYELTNDDLLSAATGELSVRAIYRDSLGFETELSAALSAVGDSVGTGAVTINGAASFAEGEVYTADTSGVRDDNGIGGFVYQWYANVNANVSLLSGETAATYTVQLSNFVADGVVNTVLGLSVSVVHTDAAGYTRDYNAVRLHADNVLSGNVELSLLGDIVVAGATVTLITAGVSNNNGGGFISYEWLRDGVTIVGANASDYELTNDDLLSAATGELSVWAIYRDSLGFETELSAALSAVGDSIGTGTVTIIGAPSFTEGAVYTAQTVDFRDANGIGSFDYQWYVNINNSVTVLASATAAIYTMALSDFVIGDDVLNPSLVLGVSVLHTDAAGYPQDYEAALPHADNVLSGNVELSLLGGIVAENATVTILTAGVSDNNGGGFISYEWLRGDATIAGEDASDYELTNDDLSAAAAGKLSARAIYRDSLGFETALSAALSAVGDSIGTGTVTIVGADSFAEGGVYTADTSGVVDDNGIGDFSYQWYANVNDNVSLLLGETGATYTVKLSDFVTDNVENTLLGLSVSVLHTDAAGYTQDYEAALPHADNVLSGNVELSLSDGIVAEGAIVTVLTASVSDENGGGFISYEWLRGDATITGANESRYELTSDDLLSAATGKLSARALYRDDLGFNTELSATLSAVGDSEGTGFVTIEGAASFAEGGVYTVQTSDFTDANGIGDFSYQWYANVNDNVSLLSGETAATYTVKLSDFVADGVINTVLGLSVLVLHTDAIGLYTQDYDAILLHNDLPLSGALKVSLSGGVVAENATVIVLTAGVSDANGGGFVSTEYEWLRGNATITGANESRYELTSDDLSAAAAGKLSARALYRDDLGFNTELSAVLPAAGDSVGTGAVTINGAASFTEGAVYTAQTVNFRDANGIGDFGYQWYVNINNSVTVLVGKTGAIYTMALSDFVIGDAVNPSLVLGVSVVHTDGANNDQVYEAVLSHVDIPLTGSLTISLSGGVVAENVTVTILTAGVSDANGGGFISYEWLRGDITITGASVSRYELTEADLTTAARGGLSARALYRDSLGFETALSAVLSAVDDRHELESGKVEIRLTGYVFNQNEAMAHIKGIAASQIAEVSYQWQTGIGAEFAEFRNVGEHGDLCLLESGHFNPQDSLRVIANITGISGHIVQLTSAVVPINFDVAGDVIIRVIGNGPVVAGAVLSADISNLYDQNGELLVGENIWLSGASDAPVAVGFTYTLVAGDIDNGRVKYRGVVNDPALFATTFENEVNTGRIDSRQVRVLLESINVAADDGIARALNDHLNTAADGLHINGATVEDSAQLAKALLSGREQNGNRFWGINEFSLNSSEGAPGEEWSWWVRGYRTHLKGTPSVGGETFDYNGDYKAFYAGLDRRLHRDVIIGMILSSDLAKLDVDWNTGVTSEGSIRQDMLSIVPYAEWTPDDNTALRIYGGYGRGDLRINVNDVETMTDSERKILGLQGIYRLSLSTNWEMSWRGDVSYVRGAADEVSRVLEGVTARHGESRLNWEIAHTTIDPGKAYWRKFLNLRWRRQFGELDNASLYDIGGGFSWTIPSHNFRFGVSGQRQLSAAEHMRESFDIYVTFGPGKINHTMRTRYSGADGGFNHRYEIGMVSDWGISTIYTNVYAERRHGGELYWGGDMELEF